jgi:hypothetical protein
MVMASKRRLRRRQCGDKKPYGTWDLAVSAAIRYRRRTGHFMRAYPCPFSGKKKHFHIGHEDQLSKYSPLD